ncbi:MAG: hypothetical protein KDL10_08595, partial [Kiritimatiellae bacterium]|nr:hypothetical protein [Kiritimatiellia bacterium]
SSTEIAVEWKRARTPRIFINNGDTWQVVPRRSASRLGPFVSLWFIRKIITIFLAMFNHKPCCTFLVLPGFARDFLVMITHDRREKSWPTGGNMI